MARVIKTADPNPHLTAAQNFNDVVLVHGEDRQSLFWFLMAIAAVIAMITLFSGWLPLVAFIAAASIVFFAYRTDIGLLLLVFFAPFTGLVVDFSQYDWSRGIPFLSSVDAPFGDFFALVLLGAVALRILVQLPNRPKLKLNPFPLIGFFAAFGIAQLLSLTATPVTELTTGIKFILRPILFMYVMFVVLPNTIIQTKTQLTQVLNVLYATGVISAVIGFLSFFVVGPFGGLWNRATPFGVFGIAPLGYNHNLLAEVLVIVMPIGIYLLHTARSAQKRRWLFLANTLIAVIALLTFARTAWIVLAVELIVGLYLYKHELKKPKFNKLSKQFASLGLVMLFPVMMYMAAISSSVLVAGSTSTRLDLTMIAWENFLNSPLVGNGPGSFIPIVGDTRLFVIEYGNPFDAHGMIQKVIAENGLIGLITWLALLAAVLGSGYAALQHVGHNHEKEYARMAALFVMAVGAMVYQLLNTSYYNAKLWLPIGLLLVGTQLVWKIPKRKLK